MGLARLVMACYLGLHGILTGLVKSPDHPSRPIVTILLLSIPDNYSKHEQNS